jgi:hypothetical protein
MPTDPDVKTGMRRIASASIFIIEILEEAIGIVSASIIFCAFTDRNVPKKKQQSTKGFAVLELKFNFIIAPRRF